MEDSTTLIELIKLFEQLESAVVLLLDSPCDLRENYMRLLSDSLSKLNQYRYNLNAQNLFQPLQDDI